MLTTYKMRVTFRKPNLIKKQFTYAIGVKLEGTCYENSALQRNTLEHDSPHLHTGVRAHRHGTREKNVVSGQDHRQSGVLIVKVNSAV